MATKEHIDRAVPPAGETYDAKVERLTRRLRDAEETHTEVVNAQAGYVYRWTPGEDDKSSASVGARARLRSLGYELATDGEHYSTVSGGLTWRIPTPVYELLEQQKMDRLAARFKLLGVDPESMTAQVVTRRRGNREIVETYI